MNLIDYVRTIPHFPKEGINFYDISTLTHSSEAWAYTISALKDRLAPYAPDLLLGVESRGFLVASPLALAMNLGFGMIRKKGKLPGAVLSYSYDLEYGSDTIELQPDLIPDGARVALVDDLLATGGTLQAAESLVEKAGATIVAHACIIELDGLGGRDKLTAPFEALLRCPA